MRASLLILVGLAAAACGVIIAPAAIANAESAAVTIGQLEAQGFDVKVNRIGSAPLSQCVLPTCETRMNKPNLRELPDVATIAI